MANIQIIQGDFEKKLKLQFAPGIRAGFPSPSEMLFEHIILLIDCVVELYGLITSWNTYK